MDPKDKPQDRLYPMTEEDATQEAILDFLKERHPNLSDEMARMWATEITDEAGYMKENRMPPELRARIEEAREKASALLRPLRVARIREDYRDALRAKERYEILALHDQAEKMGIDLSDIEHDIENETEGDIEHDEFTLDIARLLKGEFPPSGLS